MRLFRVRRGLFLMRVPGAEVLLSVIFTVIFDHCQPGEYSPGWLPLKVVQNQK